MGFRERKNFIVGLGCDGSSLVVWVVWFGYFYGIRSIGGGKKYCVIYGKN